MKWCLLTQTRAPATLPSVQRAQALLPHLHNLARAFSVSRSQPSVRQARLLLSALKLLQIRLHPRVLVCYASTCPYLPSTQGQPCPRNQLPLHQLRLRLQSASAFLKRQPHEPVRICCASTSRFLRSPPDLLVPHKHLPSSQAQPCIHPALAYLQRRSRNLARICYA